MEDGGGRGRVEALRKAHFRSKRKAESGKEETTRCSVLVKLESWNGGGSGCGRCAGRLGRASCARFSARGGKPQPMSWLKSRHPCLGSVPPACSFPRLAENIERAGPDRALVSSHARTTAERKARSATRDGSSSPQIQTGSIQIVPDRVSGEIILPSYFKAERWFGLRGIPSWGTKEKLKVQFCFPVGYQARVVEWQTRQT